MLTRLACSLSLVTLLSACFLSCARAAEPDQEALSIIHQASPQPAIHGPRVVGSTPGRPFLFLIPATGEKPLHFAAKNLPQGLTLDPETGIITGSLEQPGSTVVEHRSHECPRHCQARVDDRWRPPQAGPHAADGLEFVELLGLCGQRCQGPRRGRRHG